MKKIESNLSEKLKEFNSTELTQKTESFDNQSDTVVFFNKIQPKTDLVGRRYIVNEDGTITWLDKVAPRIDEIGRRYVIKEDSTIFID